MTNTPRVQWQRKLGHLWQTCYGPVRGRTFYGHGTTRRAATAQAKKRAKVDIAETTA